MIASAAMQPTVDFATPEDVPLSFELAGPGSRILAALIDQLIISFVQMGLLAVALFVGALAGEINEAMLEDTVTQMQLNGPTMFMVGVWLVATFVLNFGYYIVCEMATNGQTPGKRALKIRVIRDGGYPLTLTASFLRNLGRVADMLPSMYQVGLAAMIISRKEKRLGDMMAGTLVVKENRLRPDGLPFGDTRYSTLAERRFHLDRQALAQLGEEQERVLETFFSRSRLEPEQELRTVHALSEGFARHLPTHPGFVDHQDRLVFLREIYLALRERRELG